MAPTDFIVWIEPAAGGRVPVIGGLEFGRSDECEIHINSPKASRHHAAIHVQKHAGGLEYLLIDLGSANGSFVNDHRITRWAQLHDGDRIRIADQEYAFRIRSEAGGPGNLISTGSTLKEARSGAGWLLVCDIVDSTPLVRQMPADQLASLLARWLRACTVIIEDRGGSVAELRGDGFLAYWGDAAGDADRVASAILELRKCPATLPFRVVLHYGEFTVTTDSTQGGERLIGPAVYFVFRAEKIAASVQRTTLLSSAAKEAIGECLTLVCVPGEFELKGFDGAHVFFTLEE